MAIVTNMGASHIDAATVTVVNEALDKLAIALEPILVNLEPNDHRRYGSINEQHKLSVNREHDYSVSDKALRSPDVD